MSLLLKNAVLNNINTDVLISEGIISQIKQNIDESADKIINADNKILIPSFKNGHTHSGMTILRGYADDMKLGPWLEEKIWPAEAKFTPKAVYWGTRLAALEMIKSGTTFCNDMYFNFEMSQKAYIDAGIKSASGPALFDFFDQKKAEEMKANCNIAIENTNISKNNSLSLAAHSIYTLSRESLEWIANLANSKNIPVHIHLAETEREVEDCITRHGIRPTELLKETGLLDTDLIAAHTIWLTDYEIDLLDEYNVTVVHNPVSNMKISTGGVFPFKKFKDRNIKMMLGTDSCASNNNLDMFEDMKIAALLHKFHNNDPEIMKAEEIFDISTGNEASVFPQLSSKIEVGTHADVLLLNPNTPELVPSHNLISNIVYSANGSCVDTVICNGEILMENRITKDEEEILENVRFLSKNLFY
ncbi:MAG: amidohydrolase [Spirochaetia bacterium]|jgi:5-methylthioadenosine/S-adenosylhomocysteine deaminase|nr:amidohydrolase [Spirochaetia bacterium]